MLCRNNNCYGIIYKVINKINGKIYIGQTMSDLLTRKLSHERKGYHLYNAIKKHGKDKFIWETLEYCVSKEELDRKEKEYILLYDSFNNGYNLTLGGEGHSGNMSNVTKKKISSALLGKNCGENNPYYGKKHSEEIRNKISKAVAGKQCGEKNGFYGRKHKYESRTKMSEAHKGERNNNFGKKLSEDHRRKISESNKGKHSNYHGCKFEYSEGEASCG